MMLAINTMAKPLEINEFNSKIKRYTSDVLFSESKTFHTVSPVLYTIFDCDDKTKLEFLETLNRITDLANVQITEEKPVEEKIYTTLTVSTNFNEETEKQFKSLKLNFKERQSYSCTYGNKGLLMSAGILLQPNQYTKEQREFEILKKITYIFGFKGHTKLSEDSFFSKEGLKELSLLDKKLITFLYTNYKFLSSGYRVCHRTEFNKQATTKWK